MDDLLRDLLDHFDETVQVIRSGYLWAMEKPQAKQSTRFRGKAFGRNRHAWTDKKKVAYLRTLALEFRASYTGDLMQGHVRLTILFCFPFTQSQQAMVKLGWALTDKHVDVDNLLKPASDALKQIVFADDCQIVEVRARKIRYARGCLALRVDEIRPKRTVLPD